MMEALSQFWASYSNLINLCLLNAFIAYGVFLALSANMFTLGTGGFMSLGAYTSVLLTMGSDAPFVVALFAGGLVSACAALLIGAPVLRLRGDYFMLATFAFTEVVRVLALNLESVTGGAIGIMNIPTKTETWHYIALLVVLIVLIRLFRRSHFGLAVAAIKRDDVVPQAVGIDVFRYRLSIFTVSGFIAGLAGGFAAHMNYFIAPGDFGLARSIDALAFPILGGVNALLGPILGAVFTTTLPEVLRFSSQLREILMGVLIIGVVLYLPGGMYSLLSFSPSALGKIGRKAAAKGLAAPNPAHGDGA